MSDSDENPFGRVFPLRHVVLGTPYSSEHSEGDRFNVMLRDAAFVSTTLTNAENAESDMKKTLRNHSLLKSLTTCVDEKVFHKTVISVGALPGSVHDAAAEPVVYVGFRCTETAKDVLADITPMSVLNTEVGGRVHRGVSTRLAATPTELVLHLLRENYRVVLTGHSLGGALATMVGIDLLQGPLGHDVSPVWEAVEEGEKKKHLTIVTFGAFPVVDPQLADSLRSVHKLFINVCALGDPIPLIMAASAQILPKLADAAFEEGTKVISSLAGMAGGLVVSAIPGAAPFAGFASSAIGKGVNGILGIVRGVAVDTVKTPNVPFGHFLLQNDDERATLQFPDNLSIRRLFGLTWQRMKDVRNVQNLWASHCYTNYLNIVMNHVLSCNPESPNLNDSEDVIIKSFMDTIIPTCDDVEITGLLREETMEVTIACRQLHANEIFFDLLVSWNTDEPKKDVIEKTKNTKLQKEVETSEKKAHLESRVELRKSVLENWNLRSYGSLADRSPGEDGQGASLGVELTIADGDVSKKAAKMDRISLGTIFRGVNTVYPVIMVYPEFLEVAPLNALALIEKHTMHVILQLQSSILTEFLKYIDDPSKEVPPGLFVPTKVADWLDDDMIITTENALANIIEMSRVDLFLQCDEKVLIEVHKLISNMDNTMYKDDEDHNISGNKAKLTEAFQNLWKELKDRSKQLPPKELSEETVKLASSLIDNFAKIWKEENWNSPLRPFDKSYFNHIFEKSINTYNPDNAQYKPVISPKFQELLRDNFSITHCLELVHDELTKKSKELIENQEEEDRERRYKEFMSYFAGMQAHISIPLMEVQLALLRSHIYCSDLLVIHRKGLKKAAGVAARFGIRLLAGIGAVTAGAVGVALSPFFVDLVMKQESLSERVAWQLRNIATVGLMPGFVIGKAAAHGIFDALHSDAITSSLKNGGMAPCCFPPDSIKEVYNTDHHAAFIEWIMSTAGAGLSLSVPSGEVQIWRWLEHSRDQTFIGVQQDDERVNAYVRNIVKRVHSMYTDESAQAILRHAQVVGMIGKLRVIHGEGFNHVTAGLGRVGKSSLLHRTTTLGGGSVERSMAAVMYRPLGGKGLRVVDLPGNNEPTPVVRMFSHCGFAVADSFVIVASIIDSHLSPTQKLINSLVESVKERKIPFMIVLNRVDTLIEDKSWNFEVIMKNIAEQVEIIQKVVGKKLNVRVEDRSIDHDTQSQRKFVRYAEVDSSILVRPTCLVSHQMIPKSEYVVEAGPRLSQNTRNILNELRRRGLVDFEEDIVSIMKEYLIPSRHHGGLRAAFGEWAGQ